VLCVDDNRDLAVILGQCISLEPDMLSVGSLFTATHLRAELKKSRPDVVLLDLSMPGDDPLEVLRALTVAARSATGKEANAPAPSPIRFIILSGRSDQEVADSAAKAGAWGFISKTAEIPVIMDAIRSVAHGQVAFGTWL
jgi:DNA-binding NarL/FixJ family response regulator